MSKNLIQRTLKIGELDGCGGDVGSEGDANVFHNMENIAGMIGSKERESFHVAMDVDYFFRPQNRSSLSLRVFSSVAILLDSDAKGPSGSRV